MARNVGTVVTPTIVLNVDTIKTDGTTTNRQYRIDDMVADLRYAANGKVNAISGRVSEITYKVAKSKRFYTSVAKAKSWFRYDVTPEFIVIDSSTNFHSNLTKIPVLEILENTGETDIKRLMFYLTYGFIAEVTRSDESVNTFEVNEGDILSNIRYLFRGDETVIDSAKLIAIKRNGTSIKPISLVLNLNNKIREIPVEQLVSIDGAKAPIAVSGSIMNAIDPDTTAEQVLYLGEGGFAEDLTIDKNVVIKGNKVGIFATSKNRNHETFEGESVLKGNISLKKGCKVIFDGVVLTKDAKITLEGNSEVTFQNCILTHITPKNGRDFPIYAQGTDPTKLEFKNCYFGQNPKNGANKMYNLMELDVPLRDGSCFSGNYFEKGTVSHNDINIYGVVDGATLTIENNTWEYSGNAVRLGMKGNPECTVNVLNNTYMSTDHSDNDIWAGLVIIQPYVKETTSFAKTRVNINKTVHNDLLHIYYLYTNSGCTQYTEENAPVVYVNGKLQPKLQYLLIT